MYSAGVWRKAPALHALTIVLFAGGAGYLTTCHAAAPMPVSEINAIQASYDEANAARSEARQRMSIRRVIRSGEALLLAHPAAPNRFDLLRTLYSARQHMVKLDGSPENREALLEVCRQLVEAPKEYAEIRFDAELLLSQTEQARKGATPTERAAALRTFIDRYRDTSVERKMLQIVTVMTLEMGNDALQHDLRETIDERFWHDLEMVRFNRDKLGGQVMAAPFVATLTDSDGMVNVFPMDRLSRSTLFFVWSKDTEDLDQRIAKWNTLTGVDSGPKDPAVTHLLEPELFDVISLNLDELPDAGASILREKGVSWKALHLPGGRNSEIYRTYLRHDPMGLHVSPTGCAALLLPGSHPDDYPRRVFSYMQKEKYYLRQLTSYFSGDFLVMDPANEFDPALPPELKTTIAGSSKAVTLPRSPNSVPANILQEIQSCFVSPPFSYQLSYAEALKNYQKAEGLCRKAMASHARAPDIWLVQNRLIVSLMGQWRSTSDPAFLMRAGEIAKQALLMDSPDGAKLVPRLCMARINLRDAEQDPAAIIKGFVDTCGGEEQSPMAVAAASYLSLDVGNRALQTHYREVLLANHADNPNVATIVSALLDRFHRFQMYFHPYHRGWSFGRRAARYYKSGAPDDGDRRMNAEFTSLAGQPVPVPGNNAAEWNVLLFAQPPLEKNKPRNYKPWQNLSELNKLAASRDAGEVKIWNVSFDEDAGRVASSMTNTFHEQTLLVPGGLRHPMVQRLGIYKGGTRPNMAIVSRDGEVVSMVSGLAWQGSRPATVLQSALEWSDEAKVDAALAKGDLDSAHRIALLRAPILTPDPKARRRPAGPSQTHLRCRAKVYIAMKDWRKALPDVDLLVDRQRRSDSGMSVESPELLEAIRMQSIVHERLDLNKDQGEESP